MERYTHVPLMLQLVVAAVHMPEVRLNERGDLSFH